MRSSWIAAIGLGVLLGGSIGSALAASSSSGEVAGEMAMVPAGPFLMGGEFDEERPRHRVDLDAFWIDRTEVTNERYAAYLRATGAPAPRFWNKSDRFHSGEKFPRHPVVGISWFEAKSFCEWEGKRLPTEAEWEKAARGGREGLAFPWGDAPDSTRANYDTQATVPVGGFPANDYGLFDMSGNVWEWVADWFDARYYETGVAANPAGPDMGKERVLRGGSYVDGIGPNRVAHRHWHPPATQLKWLGVRCAKTS